MQRYLGNHFVAQYCRQCKMQLTWSLLCCTILQTVFYVDILVITLLHNILDRVLCRYVSHYFAAQYCRQCTMYIPQSLLCCTILQAAYIVDMLGVTLLHNILDSVLCRYLDHYIAVQYCRQRTMQICWSLLCCTILQIAVLCRYLGHYFAAQYCRQRTMQISWLLLSYTILQAAYYVDILVITFLHSVYVVVITLLHNIIGSILAYYVDILVITLLHNTVGSVLYRYLGHYFTA